MDDNLSEHSDKVENNHIDDDDDDFEGDLDDELVDKTFDPEKEKDQGDDESEEVVVVTKKIGKRQKKKAKKSRKEEYHDKHAPENKNPTGMDDLDILKGIAHHTIVPGAPPKKKKCTSEQWQMGIQFLYFAATMEEIPNWFYCTKCTWLSNTILGGGTGNLMQHAKSHISETYKLTKEELLKAFEKCCEFVKKTGKSPDFKKIPLPKEWYEQISHINQFHFSYPYPFASVKN